MWLFTAVNNWNLGDVCTHPLEIQVITDAFQLRWDAVTNGKIALDDWKKHVFCVSSNNREMMVILLAIIPFRTILKSKSVQILSNNISSIAYLNLKGWPCQTALQIATSIWTDAVHNRMSIQCAYIAGRKNLAAEVAYIRKAQLDTSIQSLFVNRSDMGPSHNRQICKLSKYTTPSVQQSLKRTTFSSYLCAKPKQLVTRKQLCKRSILSHSKGSGCYIIPEDSSNVRD